MHGGGRILAVLALGICNAASSVRAQSMAEQLAAGKIDMLREQARAPQAVAVLNSFLGRPDLNAGMKDIPAAARDCPVEGAGRAQVEVPTR